MNKITDLSYLEMVSDGDKDFINQVVQSFIDNNTEIIANLENEMKSENWIKMGQLIHKMKPSLEMVGLTPLKEKMTKAETNLKAEQDIEETIPLVNEIIANCRQAIDELGAEL